MTGFDTNKYWRDRLVGEVSLGSVGWAGLGERFNASMYRVRRQVFLATVGPRLATTPPRRVLDIASGSGFYVDLWSELGAGELIASDLAAPAVEYLRRRFPGHTVTQLDVSGAMPETLGRFDWISAMDVLFHIVDDAHLERAIANVAALLEPGGRFVFSDNLVHGERAARPHIVNRTLEEITQLLSEHGLEIQLRRPMFYLMNEPVDTSSRALKLWWRGLAGSLSYVNGLGAAAGAALYPIERRLVSTRSEGPSTEIVVCAAAR